MSVKVVDTVAADQQGASNTGWHLHYAQMSAGQFKGRLIEAELGGVQVYEEHMNTRIEQYYKAPGDALVFSFDMADAALYLLDASTQNLWITPENYREIAVVVPTGQLRALNLHRTFEDLLLTPLKSSHGAVFMGWLSAMLGRIAATADENAETSALLAEQLADDCLFVLEQSAQAQQSSTIHRVRKHRRIVQQVFDRVSAYPTEQFSAVELAEIAGASFQQLRLAFAECVGMPPTVWLRMRRLNLARQALLAAGPGDTTVAEVAMSYSFWHLGRFAQAYRELFLECPGETLGRVR
ncbi:helix-turn-helix domain-containing protein [Pseudomonas japonica]|uniref:helix-turn-helix domain-containing protein n=1 Tax=Pseudomonas japonica TaxID=256466 RepID=UPI0015E41E3B|nr:helix-turn-helix domain-containing protein [Pseudomonas japonica]MBA1245044.1 helix-turn-helix domain-containing protein [Pseudomonas japonica]